jgi:hypothetical protein
MVHFGTINWIAGCIFDTKEEDTTDTFINYALDQAILCDPFGSEYLTQAFIPVI